MNVTEFIFVRGEPCETYCHVCGQLRLWCREEAPTRCGNCASDRIEVGGVGSPRLHKLRYGEGSEP